MIFLFKKIIHSFFEKKNKKKNAKITRNNILLLCAKHPNHVLKNVRIISVHLGMVLRCAPANGLFAHNFTTNIKQSITIIKEFFFYTVQNIVYST